MKLGLTSITVAAAALIAGSAFAGDLSGQTASQNSWNDNVQLIDMNGGDRQLDGSWRDGVRLVADGPRARNRGDRRRLADRSDRRRGNHRARNYNRGRHGDRHRNRRGRYTHYHNGWWYAIPWWLSIVSRLDDDRRYSGSERCEHWSNRCADNWGYRNNDYWGCMRYYDCAS